METFLKNTFSVAARELAIRFNTKHVERLQDSGCFWPNTPISPLGRLFFLEKYGNWQDIQMNSETKTSRP